MDSAMMEWLLAQSGVSMLYGGRCNMAERSDASLAAGGGLERQRQSRSCGVWHAAGVLADAVLARQDASALARVCAPKTHGALGLHYACARAAVSAFVLFSSVAALLGGAGQPNYAAANACLDALASCRDTCGGTAASVQWGAWAEVGMAARSAASERMAAMEAASGFGRMGLAQGLAALGAATQSGAPSAVSYTHLTLPTICSV